MRPRRREFPGRERPPVRMPRGLRGAGVCREDGRLGREATDLLREAVEDLPLRSDFTRVVLERIRAG